MNHPIIRNEAELLQEALRRDEEARDFYDQLLLTHTHAGLVRDLLEWLKAEEVKHGDLIQKMITRLDAGENLQIP
jgi:rubrerythrin